MRCCFCLDKDGMDNGEMDVDSRDWDSKELGLPPLPDGQKLQNGVCFKYLKFLIHVYYVAY
jgi:hypothetical protein